MYSSVDYSTGSEMNQSMLVQFCEDIELVKHFYTGVLGLSPVNYGKGEYIDYKLKNILVMFSQTKILSDELSYLKKDMQSTLRNNLSFSLKLSESEFKVISDRLKNTFPRWHPDGFWYLSLKDPVGNKIDLYMEPARSRSLRN